MDKAELVQAVSDARKGWDAVIDELGAEGLEHPGATGEWRVRDVLAHFNGWDRWQLVQLRCAFTSETPTDEELTGGVDFPDNDDMQEDAMNEMFRVGNLNRPLDDVVADFREVSAMRASWLDAASQAQLNTIIGADWAGGTARIIRLASEVPSVGNPEPAWHRLLDQVEHQKEHLRIVKEWMST